MPLNKNKEYYQKTEWTLDTVQDEINNGLQLLNSIQNPIVSFFGSHRVKPGTKYYEHCKKLSNELGKNGKRAYKEKYNTISEALRREIEIKGWRRDKKS